MGQLIDSGLPCPHCQSSDARAEYTDNYFCFSCHKSEKKNHWEKKKPVAIQATREIKLPEDFTYNIPVNIKVHLYKKHFTDELISAYRLGWSPSTPVWSERKQESFNSGGRLILPYYGPDGKGQLRYFEARSYEPDNKLKYITVGGKQECFFAGLTADRTKSIVVVEDMISAMRVGAFFPCVALRGTSFSEDKLLQLAFKADNFVLWLDSDGPGKNAARKVKKRLGMLANSVRTLVTSEDPKCYSDRMIHTYLTQVLCLE